MISEFGTTSTPLASIKFDGTVAAKQLELLGFRPGETPYIRAFFPKGDPRTKDGKLARSNNKSRRYDPKEIEQWNREGRGIYLVINEGGASKADITECRAIFYEHDDLPKEDQLFLWEQLGLPEPTLQIDSGNKSIQNYWVFTDRIEPELWSFEEADKFRRGIQPDLVAHAQADPATVDLSRVMRLAGAYHISWDAENETSRVTGATTIVGGCGKRYSYRELRDAIPRQQRPVPEPKKATSPKPETKKAHHYIDSNDAKLLDFRNVSHLIASWNDRARPGWSTFQCPVHTRDGQAHSDNHIHVNLSTGKWEAHCKCDPKEVYAEVCRLVGFQPAKTKWRPNPQKIYWVTLLNGYKIPAAQQNVTDDQIKEVNRDWEPHDYYGIGWSPEWKPQPSDSEELNAWDDPGGDPWELIGTEHASSNGNGTEQASSNGNGARSVTKNVNGKPKKGVIHKDGEPPSADTIASLLADDYRQLWVYSHVEERWYRYAKGYWQVWHDKQFRSDVYKLLKSDYGYRVIKSKNYMESILYFLEVNLTIPDIPCWDRAKFINFRNGILNVETGALLKHTPEAGFKTILPFDYNPVSEKSVSVLEALKQSCPNVYNFFERSMDGDAKKIMKLIATVNATITFKFHDLQLFTQIKGRPATGKNTFSRLLEKIVGADNKANTNLKSLEEPTELAALVGKQLVVIPDARKAKDNVETLLNLTGGTAIRYREIYKARGEAKFYGHLLVISNNAILSGDTTGIDRRLNMIEFLNPIPEAERNTKYETILEEEIPNLIQIALMMSPDSVEAYLKGIGEGKITEFEKAAWVDKVESNQLANWANDNLILDPKGTMPMGDGTRGEGGKFKLATAFGNYRDFCEQEGVAYPLTRQDFAKTLMTLCHDALKWKQIEYKRTPKGRIFIGVRLRDPRTDLTKPLLDGATDVEEPTSKQMELIPVQETVTNQSNTNATVSVKPMISATVPASVSNKQEGNTKPNITFSGFEPGTRVLAHYENPPRPGVIVNPQDWIGRTRMAKSAPGFVPVLIDGYDDYSWMVSGILTRVE